MQPFIRIPREASFAAAVDRRNLRRDANFVGAAMIAAVVAMNFLAGILLFFLSAFGILRPDAVDYGLSPNGAVWLDTALYLLFLAPPVIIVAAVCKKNISPFSPRERIDPLSFVCLVGVGLAVCVAANFAVNILAEFFSRFGIGWPDATENIDSSVGSLVVNLIATALIPGLVEETVFRGYILQSLRPYGDGFAVVLSSLLFALLHGNVMQIPFALIVGLVLGYLTVQTNNLLPAVAAHTLNNAMAVVSAYVAERFSEDVASRADLLISLGAALIGVVGFLILKATDSPYIRKPSGGCTSLTVRQKWEIAFSAPALTVATVMMILLTLFNTLAYSFA